VIHYVYGEQDNNSIIAVAPEAPEEFALNNVCEWIRSGTAGRLEYTEGGKLGFIDFVVRWKFFCNSDRRMKLNRSGVLHIYCYVLHVAFHTPERKLLVLLEIVGNNVGPEIMNTHEFYKIHGRISRFVLLVMFYHKGDTGKLMTFRK